MISQTERFVIRDLAKRYAELCEQPVMRQRRDMWYAHNDLKSTSPMILVFPEGAWRELITPSELKCEDEELRRIEWKLRARLFKHECIRDDSVAEKDWYVNKHISETGWGLRPNQVVGNEFEVDAALGYVPKAWRKGFRFEEHAMPFSPVIEGAADLKKIRMPEVVYDEKATLAAFEMERDLLGDILDVKTAGKRYIQFALIELYSDFRGLEDTLYDLMDEPEMVHDALHILEEGYKGLVRQYTEMGLYSRNDREDYCGSGGVGYTNDLPKPEGEGAKPSGMWAFAESQEFSTVSPAMHKEFAIDYEARLLEPFGLKSYGCCEALEDKLDYVLSMPNMRRVSISPWANVEKCAAKMGSKAVFSWKPNPSYFVNPGSPDFMRGYIRDLLSKTKDNVLEIVLKDTHTCHNSPERFGQWTDLVREEISNRD